MTEEGNPGNWRGVARVVARLHTPLLDEGVRLVDTPGVGSVHEHNTLATDAYLPSLDAAVLVVSADPPISKAERAFLERVTCGPGGRARLARAGVHAIGPNRCG